MKQLILILICSATLVACAHRQRIIVDMKGVDAAQYQRDLVECQSYAAQVARQAGKGAVGGAVVGGAVGAIIGDSDTAKKGAGVGAVTGLVKGGAKTRREKQNVVKNCLRGRGYTVLN